MMNEFLKKYFGGLTQSKSKQREPLIGSVSDSRLVKK